MVLDFCHYDLPGIASAAEKAQPTAEMKVAVGCSSRLSHVNRMPADLTVRKDWASAEYPAPSYERDDEHDQEYDEQDSRELGGRTRYATKSKGCRDQRYQ